MNEEKASTPPAAARIHVLLARDAPFAVVLRRGPSKQVCSIGWNLSGDTFQVGQWLKGRIPEYLCDLSPDGQHLLYGAEKYRLKDGSWLQYTVVSRAPYLKALKIWKSDSFYGGVFLSHDRFVLNNRFALHGSSPTETLPHPGIFRVTPSGEVKNVAKVARIERPANMFHWKFERDGWTGSNAWIASGDLEWIKESAGWELKMRGSGSFIYNVRGRRLEKTFDCARWQWADFHGERLLWAQDGRIFAAQVWNGGHGPIQQLADFNDWVFEPIIAPY